MMRKMQMIYEFGMLLFFNQNLALKQIECQLQTIKL